MKIGEEFICYQHHQVQDILDKLLKVYEGNLPTTYLCNNLKEAIEWITKANDSAIRMENKLKWYKENDTNSK